MTLAPPPAGPFERRARAEPTLPKDLVDRPEPRPAGTEADFVDLVARTSRELRGLARRLVGNDEDAADVLQEAYLRAWRALPGFRGEAQVSTWLYTITANAARTHLRRRLRVEVEPIGDGCELPDLRPEANPQAATDATDLEAALHALPPDQRVSVLCALHGVPHSVIAAQLGISTTAARVRLHRARRRLQHELASPERMT